jgi:hypothetical protein
VVVILLILTFVVILFPFLRFLRSRNGGMPVEEVE